MAGRNTRAPYHRARRQQWPETPLSGSQIGSFFPFCHWHNAPSSSRHDSDDSALALRNESPQSIGALLQTTSALCTKAKTRAVPTYRSPPKINAPEIAYTSSLLYFVFDDLSIVSIFKP